MIDNQKHEAKQFCKYHAKEVENIIHPLKSAMGIDTIIYSIFYPKDNTAFFISNNFKIIEEVIDIGYYNKEFKKILFSAQLDGKIKKFLWPTQPKTSDKIGLIFRKYGLITCINFIYCNNKDFIMNIGFASSQHDESIINIFINNTSILLDFIKYFEFKAAHIIEYKDKKRILFYKNIRYTEDLQQNKINKCLNSMSIKKFFISSIDDPFPKYFTTREYQCAQLLCEGKSFKQIATALNMSERTVEAHINLCKVKFSVTNKFHLVQKIKGLKNE